MRRLIPFLILSLIGLSVGATIVFAQGDASIQNLGIAIWPDYDRPAVLVIYRINLPLDTDLPASVSVPIPADVGEPLAVAWRSADGGLFLADYERVVEGEWATITLTTESTSAQVEYYDDYELDGSKRSFQFQWPEGYSLGNVIYEFQEPFDADTVQISPPPDQSAMRSDGLTYHVADLGSVDAGSTFDINLSYNKESDVLTIDAIGTTSPLPISTPVIAEGGTPDIAALLPYIVGGLGVLLIVAAVILYFRYRDEPTSAKPSQRRRRRTPSQQAKVDEIEASPVFCHNCGAKASASDHFCRRCGTRLRH
ncbi:MAG: hypothetical protein GTO18_03300 [Anaerolineales bacterium]|nr:hypothetical protein [Anaerolineales bacterium]